MRILKSRNANVRSHALPRTTFDMEEKTLQDGEVGTERRGELVRDN